MIFKLRHSRFNMRYRIVWAIMIAIMLLGCQSAFSASISTPTAISGGPEAADGIINTTEATDADKIQIRVYFNNATITNSTGNTIRLLNGIPPANFTSPITKTITATDAANGYLNFTLSITELPNGSYRLKAQMNNSTNISTPGPASYLNFTVNVIQTTLDTFRPSTTVTESMSYEIAYDSLQSQVENAPNTAIINQFANIAVPETISEPKITTQIFDLLKSKNPEQLAKTLGADYKDGKVRVSLSLDSNPDLISKLGQIGSIEASSSNIVQIAVSIDKINELISTPSIDKIKFPVRAHQQEIISQGVDLLEANKIKTAGIKGKGIKIAVLDLGFDTANTELAKIVESKSFRYDFGNKQISLKGYETEYVHGTAVAEIISDIAPKSELYLYTFGTEAEFLEAMDYAISKKINLISMSAGWMNYPTDDTSLMTKKVEEAINKGITFVVSSGNYAETHWEGKFTDSDSDSWHEFSGTDEGLSFIASPDRVANKIPIVVYVMWDGKKLADLNLALTDQKGKLVAESANVQKIKGDEFEYIYYLPTSAGTYNLGISSKSKPDVRVEVFSQNDLLEYSTSQGSVSVPVDAKGVISVGAINVSNLKLEPFSSQGPTNDGRAAPSLVGPDAVRTLSYGSDLFYGTSAAQPHVSGAVALMLEKNPTLTPSHILSLLQTNADKTILPQNKDSANSFGTGKANVAFIEKLSKTDFTPIKSQNEIKPESKITQNTNKGNIQQQSAIIKGKTNKTISAEPNTGKEKTGKSDLKYKIDKEKTLTKAAKIKSAKVKSTR